MHSSALFRYFHCRFPNRWNFDPTHHFYHLKFTLEDWYLCICMHSPETWSTKIHSEVCAFPGSVPEWWPKKNVCCYYYSFSFFPPFFSFLKISCTLTWDFYHFTIVTIKIIAHVLWKHYITSFTPIDFSTLPFPCILHPVFSTRRNYPTKFQLVFPDRNLLYLVQHLPVVACFHTHLRQALYACYPSSIASEQF